jgi:hypothetical protein
VKRCAIWNGSRYTKYIVTKNDARPTQTLFASKLVQDLELDLELDLDCSRRNDNQKQDPRSKNACMQIQ